MSGGDLSCDCECRVLVSSDETGAVSTAVTRWGQLDWLCVVESTDDKASQVNGPQSLLSMCFNLC